jgi:predicted  nucleic acid-binding Zn-ribbon protein
MNRTLLLILCDFLLLNLLALTRWEKVDEQLVSAEVVPVGTADGRRPDLADTDLLAALNLSLEEERQMRDALGAELENTRQTLESRDETLEEREARLARLQVDLEKQERDLENATRQVTESQLDINALADRLSRTTEEATAERIRALRLQEELAAQQAEARTLAGSVRQLEEEKAVANSEIRSLETRVEVVETERTFLRENITSLEDEIEAVREEKMHLQQQTGVLAEGVTQLAERSAVLTEEIRSNTPINANTLFYEFLDNRVLGSFRAVRSNFFGPVTRETDSRTVLAGDGERVFVLFHVDQTVFARKDSGADWESLSGSLTRGSASMPVESIGFLARDGRIAVVEVDPDHAQALGTKVYLTALEPFKFEEAVLVNGEGKYYGETAFKVDPQTPGYVMMESRIISRMFGEFSPSTGDLVFSKTGELLGIMVNRRYCALIENFRTVGSISFGTDIADQQTSEMLEALKARIAALPEPLR